MVVSGTFWIVAGGLAIGVPAALAAALAARGVVAGVLFEISPADPFTLSSSVGLILLIATLAAYVPARRASRIDPVAAVKYE
jgi:putative ABC transport system permease protein